MALDPNERFLYVAKGSNKLYQVDLAVKESKEKRPFVSKITQLESVIVQCIVSDSFGLFVLFENGSILNLDSSLQESKAIDFSLIKESIGCMSKVENNILVLGCKDRSELIILFLNEEDEASVENVSVPHEDLGCGSVGISSVFLHSSGNSLLFSCVPENPDSDDVPLLALENIANSGEFVFSYYLDPCAARPPRPNQFYFVTLPVAEWANNLSDLVVLGNFGSPDLGACGRLKKDGPIETFYIDNDEGLAQLPFVNNDTAYPVGLALDLSSKRTIENTTDPDAPDYPPAPIVWILTNTAQLCPFSLLKTDESEPHTFMRKNVPAYKIDSPLDSSESQGSKPSIIIAPALQSTPSIPQTPSKVPLEKLASLQKSTETVKLEPIVTSHTLKTASEVKTSEELQSSDKAQVSEKPVDEAVVLVKAVEKMETINVGPYQNILLSEIASTHASMQEDIFALKQLSLKNSLLLRRNSQKYFNSLAALEKYAETLEKLVASSGKVFEDLKGRVEMLKSGLLELLMKEKQVKAAWARAKQDKKIDWDSKIKVLNKISEDLFDKLERVRIFMNNPSEVSKYRATLESFVDSAQEQIQLLMVHIANIFCCDTEKVILPNFAELNLSPSLSSESLMEQMNVLDLNSSSPENLSRDPLDNQRKLYDSILKSAKARGARLLIPRKMIVPTSIKPAAPIKLSAEDESLISSLISSIKLTEDVPEFAEIAKLSNLSLGTKAEPPTKIDDKSKGTEFKTAPAELKPFEVKPAETKPFEFKLDKPEVKPFESKPVKPEVKPFEFKLDKPEVKPLEFKSDTTEVKPFEFKSSSETVKPFEFKPSNDTKPESNKPFEFKSLSETKADKPFEFKSLSETKSESKSEATKPFESNPKNETKPTNEKPESTVKPFEFKSPTDTKSEKSETVKPFEFSIKSENDDLKPSTTEKETKTDESPKIPSIFTAKLTENSQLPLLDSISLGAVEEKPTAEDQKSKPFPGIFGVPIETKKEETTVPNPGFSFSFKSDPVKADVVKSEDKPASFSFNPSSFKPAENTTFSITSKPELSSNPPVFGSTSLQSAPSFGSTSLPSAPVFGSTSMPSAPISNLASTFGQSSTGFSAFNAPKPGNPSGFAAFAVASSSSSNSTNSIGFSAFSAPNKTPESGLTFASFLPNKSDKESKDDSKKPNSSFSFTGFRE